MENTANITSKYNKQFDNTVPLAFYLCTVKYD